MGCGGNVFSQVYCWHVLNQTLLNSLKAYRMEDYIYICAYILAMMILEFELRILCLLGRDSIT
jgi:hypothetical protein